MLIFVDEITGDHRSLYVKNVGYGPAMDVVCNILRTGDPGETKRDEPLLLGCLGQAEKAYAYYATKPPNNAVPIIIDADRFEGALEYDDIIGNHYEIRFQQRRHSTLRLIAQRTIPWDQVARI